MRKIKIFGFGVTYIRDLTVVEIPKLMIRHLILERFQLTNTLMLSFIYFHIITSLLMWVIMMCNQTAILHVQTGDSYTDQQSIIHQLNSHMWKHQWWYRWLAWIIMECKCYELIIYIYIYIYYHTQKYIIIKSLLNVWWYIIFMLCGGHLFGNMYRANTRIAPSQWETALLCNDVSHWLGAILESALHVICGMMMPWLLTHWHLGDVAAI